MNIAFGDYSGGIDGNEATEEIIRSGVDAIHQKVDYSQEFLSKLSKNFLGWFG